MCVTVTGHDEGLWDAGNVPGLDQSAQIFTLWKYTVCMLFFKNKFTEQENYPTHRQSEQTPRA